VQTPAHDPNDYECGKRHGLEFITMLAPDGSINENGVPFTGMMRYDARIAVEEKLQEMVRAEGSSNCLFGCRQFRAVDSPISSFLLQGLFVGKEPNAMRLAICSRSGDVLEPMITPQWYVNCEGMAKKATDAVRNGSLKVVPSEHEKTWFQWLDNIRDWCVSRQLWWGHQIPAWFATRAGEVLDKNDMANNERWVVARNKEVRCNLCIS
jgi:valyl-tRNA synthetase